MVNQLMPPPGMMPPPGEGPPPGLPPGSPPMGSPPGMPPAPPPPDPTQLLPPDPGLQILMMLEALVETEGESAASEKLRLMPPAIMDMIWQSAAEMPELADLLDRLMPTEPEPVRYPRNFVIPDKPDQTTIEMLATEDEGYYREYREEVRINLGLYNAPATGEAYGVFKNFDPEKEEKFISGSLTHEVNTIKNQIAAAGLTFQIPYADQTLENDTQKVEDALYAWEAEEARRYQAGCNNPIRHDEAFYLLVCGMIAWRTGLKPNRPEHPFDDALLNPLTVFPAWDDDGLCRVTRKYSDTVAALLSCYGDATGEARKKILSATNDRVLKSKGEKRFYSTSDRVMCTTYTDRWWYAVYVDDIEVIPPTAHRYGFVNYVIAKSGLGEPMALEDVNRSSTLTSGTNMGQQLRMKYKFPSHFQFRKKAWEYECAYGTKLYNLMAIIDKPDFWIAQDEYASASGTPSLKVGGGGGNMNPIQRSHEEPLPIVASQNAALVMQPLAAMFGMERQEGALPLAARGVFESANESGNAMEGAAEAGGDKRQVHLDVLEAFHAQKQEMRLMLWRDWGHSVETSDDTYGELVVPKRQERRLANVGGPNAVKITPEMIKRTGTRVEARIRHIRMQNLAPLGNAASIWMSNNAMSAREAMELRGVSDPDAVFLEREYEQALLDPELQKVRRLKILRERDPQAAAMYEELIKQKSQPQTPPPMGGGPPGQMAPNTSAMNLPALGLGAQGPTGRPPGMMGPPQLGGSDVGP